MAMGEDYLDLIKKLKRMLATVMMGDAEHLRDFEPVLLGNQG